MSGSADSLKLVDVIRRQVWLIVGCVIVGATCAALYCEHTPVWYESRAKVLVSPKDSGLSASTGSTTSESVVSQDVLANHMEIIQSRRIVGAALQTRELETLPSIVSCMDDDTDAIDYVIAQLKLTRGGSGGAKDAHSLTIAFQHRDPKDAQLVLEAVVQEYQTFLGAQLQTALSSADFLIREVQADVEKELKAAEREYVEVRTHAPVLFQGQGSSNFYFDQFRRLNDQLLELQIKESSLKTRLSRVQAVLADREKIKNAADIQESDDKTGERGLDVLALIDSESLERVAMFAGLQTGSARAAELQANHPARLEEARTQYTHILSLKSQKQRLETEFGAEHPKVLQLSREIELVQQFIKENADQTELSWQEELGPDALIAAYAGFLKHDLAALDEKKRELQLLTSASEKEAKSLVQFELKDEMLRSKIDRHQALFEGIVEQLRGLNLASELGGHMHELLEAPRYGDRIWPERSLCGVAGIFLGLLAGLVLAVANDRLDGRFRSAEEIHQTVDLRVLGRVGHVKARRGINGLLRNANSFDGEAFRALRTVLLPAVKAGELRSLTATSALSRDGKSTLLSNLAVSFAQLNIDVLLIDADMRRPSLQKQFRLPLQNGLADVLAGKVPVPDAIKESGIEHLSVMTGGTVPSNPSELLESETFDRLLEALLVNYRLILIDVGPVLAVSDPCVISQKTDSTLLVVRPANDSRYQAKEAVDRLRSVGAPLLGCFLNTYGSTKEFEQRSGYGRYVGGYDRAYRKAAVKANGAKARNGTVAPRLRMASAK